MPSITLANLRSRILERANMENSSFISTTELNSIINIEAAELHDLVVSAFEDDFTVSTTFTISSGNTYALSSLSTPFYKLRGLDKDMGSNDYREIRAFNFNQRNTRASNIFEPYSTSVRYRLIGGNLYLTPDDAATGNYRIWYIPSYVDLASDGATLDYPENWYEYVISGATATILAKEESDPSIHLRKKDEMKARIQKMASQRDAAEPASMVRTNTTYWDE